MGEICFNFKAITEPGFETAFRFSPANSIEYGFAYQRYVALSDASIFNSPVSITKVATGLSTLRGLFIEKNAHPFTYLNLLRSFDKGGHSIPDEVDRDELPVHKLSYNLAMTNLPIDITNPYSYNFDIYQDGIILNKYRNSLDVYAQYNMQQHRNGLFLADTYMSMSKDFNMRIGEDGIKLYKQTGSDMSIYSKMFAVSKDWRLNIQEQLLASPVYDLELNIYDIYLLTPPLTGLNIINNFLGSTNDLIINPAPQIFGKFHYDPVVNLIDNFLVSPEHGIVINMIENIMSKKTKRTPNILDSLSANKKKPGFNAFDNTITERPIGNPIVYDIINAKIYNKNINIGTMSSSGVPQRIVNDNGIFHGRIKDADTSIYGIESLDSFSETVIENKWFGCSSGVEYINCFTNGFAYKKTSGTNYFNNISTGIKHDKEALYSKNVYGYKYTAPVCWLDLDTFAISERKYAITMPGAFVSSSPVDVFEYSMTSGTKFDKSSSYGSLSRVDLLDKYLFEEHQSWIINYNKSLQIDKAQKRGKKNKNSTKVKDTSIWSYAVRKNISVLYSEYHVSKKDKGISIKDSGMFLSRLSKEFNINLDSVFVGKRKLPIWIESNFYVSKRQRDIRFDESISTGTKQTNDIREFIDDVWTDKYPKDIKLWSSLSGIKYPRDIAIQYQLWGTKDAKDLAVYWQTNSSIKDAVSIDSFDIDTAIKSFIPTDFINSLYNDYAGTIIPIAKTRKQAYIDSVTKTGIKIFKDSCINKDTSASVIYKPVAMPDDKLFFDKEGHEVYIDYKNMSIVKSKIKGFISKDTTLAKEGHQVTLSEATVASKSLVESWIESGVSTLKTPNSGIIEDTLSGIHKYPKEVYDNQDAFMEKMPHLCYYDYDTWADKIAVNIQLHKQLTATMDKRKTQLLNLVPEGIRKDLRAWYDDVILAERPIRESHLITEINHAKKIAYDLSILPNDIKNWAWVYETPDPFDGDQFRIDELLLPENDTRYKDFEDIIFDKERMRPKNPVKVIDEQTFIAKFPTKHPTPKYEEIGIVYIDVETSVMHTIFLKFYRIWQTKIFEFGIMTMTQAVKQMLEYMYAWIMDYFPVEQLEEALRVFRLIRWYGETSIIQNSQYIITYEYGILESKLTSGKCLIPNDLDTNDTMYVDSKLGVIKNNPIYIGTYDAYVTFTVSNKKNTTFTFSLSNTVGSVNIYINDELVDTVSKSALNLTYELPYLGDDNIIKIEKTAANNLNGTFYIGNIRVPNATFKDLSIEFDPTLKAGNRPLNDIAKKMIAFANLYENKEEMYNVIRKGNLGVGEIYKRLDEYWKIHHQDKIKGKRLTIKET